jgi:ligand-binding SRPBCC domain-containing protein
MPIIELDTHICAPPERCFDLARSVDLHKISTAQTGEEAIAGVTSGLVGLNDEITWRARHFGIRQKLRVRIDSFERPRHFSDTMVWGAFKRFSHDHFFTPQDTGCLMHDRFDYESPLGFLGTIADRLFLEAYMRSFLVSRNRVLKRVAESEEWRALLHEA